MKTPVYELARRKRVQANQADLNNPLSKVLSLARELVYHDQPAEEQHKDKEHPASDSDFDPNAEHEETDTDADQSGAASKSKQASGSKMPPPRSRAKRTRTDNTNDSTSRCTRSRHNMSSQQVANQDVPQQQAQSTSIPSNNSPPGHQTSKGSNSSPDGNSGVQASEGMTNQALQCDHIVTLQEQVPSSSGSSRQLTKTSASGKRRPTMGHGLQDYTRRHGKMHIQFTEGKVRPTDPLHASKLSSECGMVVRGKNMTIPTHWKEFSKPGMTNVIPNAITKVAAKFDMDKTDEVAKGVCTNILQKGVRQQRYRLKRDYFDGRTIAEALANKPPNMTQENWAELVNNFSDEKYQEICEKNKENRKAVKQHQKTGSRCYVAHRNYLKSKYNDLEPGLIDFYKECHTSNKHGTMSEKAQEVYNEMDKLRSDYQSEGVEPRSDIEIAQQVLNKEKGKRSTYLSSLGYSSISTSTGSSSSARIKELEARLEQRDKEAREASEKHEKELAARLEAQQEKIEELTRRQQDELESLKKTQQEQSEAFEKKQQEIDTILQYLFRNQGEAQNPAPKT